MQLENTLGTAAMLDAAGIVAMFASITRVVDLTGHKSTEIQIASKVTNAMVWLRRNSLSLIGLFCLLVTLWWMRT